jgi:hypothetical protein
MRATLIELRRNHQVTSSLAHGLPQLRTKQSQANSICTAIEQFAAG